MNGPSCSTRRRSWFLKTAWLGVWFPVWIRTTHGTLNHLDNGRTDDDEDYPHGTQTCPDGWRKVPDDGIWFATDSSTLQPTSISTAHRRYIVRPPMTNFTGRNDVFSMRDWRDEPFSQVSVSDGFLDAAADVSLYCTSSLHASSTNDPLHAMFRQVSASDGRSSSGGIDTTVHVSPASANASCQHSCRQLHSRQHCELTTCSLKWLLTPLLQ